MNKGGCYKQKEKMQPSKAQLQMQHSKAHIKAQNSKSSREDLFFFYFV